MNRFMTGLLALACLLALPFAAQAQGTVTYKPGVIKAALAKGETVLVQYKSTW